MQLLLLAALTGSALGYAGVPASSRVMPRAPTAAAAQMSAVTLADFTGANIGQEDVSLKVAKAGAYVVHRKVVAEQANMRLGTAVAKTRSEVRGGGRKPYKQKGTGRARRGSTRSPLIVGGGKSFGPRQKSYRLKMNKKEKKLALSTALMGSVPRMTIVNDFEDNFSSPKTGDMRAFLERLGADTSGKQNCLMITKERHENTCGYAGMITNSPAPYRAPCLADRSAALCESFPFPIAGTFHRATSRTST
jgi:large subunit ribosomal protein L4